MTTSSMPCMVVVVLLTMNRLAMVFMVDRLVVVFMVDRLVVVASMVDRLVVEMPLTPELFIAPRAVVSVCATTRIHTAMPCCSRCIDRVSVTRGTCTGMATTHSGSMVSMLLNRYMLIATRWKAMATCLMI